VEDLPRQSSFTFNILVLGPPDSPYLQRRWARWDTDPVRRSGIRTYLALQEGADPQTVQAKLLEVVRQFIGPEVADRDLWHLQALFDIHLESGSRYGLSFGGARAFNGASGIAEPGSLNQIVALSVVALSVLLIACVNFVNLTVAQSLHRTKEIGLRKSIGATRINVATQFFVETASLSSISMVIAIILTTVLLPDYNTITRKDSSLLSHPWLLAVGFPVFLVGVGFLAGLYPAVRSALISPAEAFVNRSHTGRRRSPFQGSLVVFQFSVSALLAVSAIVVRSQVAYLDNKDLGFNVANVAAIPLFDWAEQQNDREALKAQFSQLPGVISAAGVRGWPVGFPPTVLVPVQPQGSKLGEHRMLFVGGDEDLFDTYGMRLVAGKGLTNRGSAEVVLNQTAVRQLGWDNPIGKTWQWTTGRVRKHLKVVGIVEDFHTHPFSQPIQPVFITFPQRMTALLLKIDPDRMQETLQLCEEKWEELRPGEDLLGIAIQGGYMQSEYHLEDRKANLIAVRGASVAVCLACLGLFGLATLMLHRSRKEIGIRKALGATVTGIVLMFTKSYLRLVLLANVIAWPVAYYLLNQWLSVFAYRVNVEVWHFALGTETLFFLTLLPVGVQTVKTGSISPVDALREE
jgi:putative ABC transport system permease protein